MPPGLQQGEGQPWPPGLSPGLLTHPAGTPTAAPAATRRFWGHCLLQHPSKAPWCCCRSVRPSVWPQRSSSKPGPAPPAAYPASLRQPAPQPLAAARPGCLPPHLAPASALRTCLLNQLTGQLGHPAIASGHHLVAGPQNTLLSLHSEPSTKWCIMNACAGADGGKGRSRQPSWKGVSPAQPKGTGAGRGSRWAQRPPSVPGETEAQGGHASPPTPKGLAAERSGPKVLSTQMEPAPQTPAQCCPCWVANSPPGTCR